jgi:hypothetical protein
MGGQNQCHIFAPTLAVSKCASKGEGGGGQGGTLNVKRHSIKAAQCRFLHDVFFFSLRTSGNCIIT